MIKDMLGYYNLIKSHNIDLLYSGPLWADGIEGLGSTLRKRVELDDLPLPVSQSVFSVFVEQMNNMLMYSAEKQNLKIPGNKNADVSRGVFVLGSKDKVYYIQCGNVMESETVEFVRNRIDYLNTLDKESLRKHYMEQIKGENTNPGSKGGGLGLIEIARRAASPIEYDFIPYGDGLTFFTMYVKVG